MEGLINLMEETVSDKIDQLWADTDYCKCDRCRMDIATYALNRLPAQYVQSLKGKVLYRLESSQIQSDIEVTVVVSQGIEIVGKEPHRDANNSEEESENIAEGKTEDISEDEAEDKTEGISEDKGED